MSLLTDRTFATGVTLDDLIHIVITGDTSQNPAGSSFKATIGQVAIALSGSSGTSGTSGSSGSNGTNGTNGTSGTNGTNGTSGTNGSGRAWGSFVSLVDQNLSVSGTVYSMSAATSTGAFDVSVSGGSKFIVANSGVYNIQFSAQINKSSGAKPNIFIWLSKNGLNLSHSNTDLYLGGGSNERLVAAWNWVVDASAGDYYEIKMSATDTVVFLDYVSSPTLGPDIPSVIITLTQV